MKHIVMPPGGQTTDTSLVARWLVEVGDAVKVGDPLLEVETDKATLPVESFAAGTVLDILVPEGESAAEGDALAIIGEPGELERTKAPPEPEPEAQDDYRPIGGKLESPPPSSEPEPGGRVRAMPNAKLAAKEHGVPLEAVAAEIEGPFVTRQDVERYAEARKSAGTRAGEETFPLSRMRRTIAARMLESVQACPVFHATVEVDMTACKGLREETAARCPGGKLGWNDILMKAVAAACKTYPAVNGRFGEQALVLHHQVNVGLAVSVPDGLVVPVCRDVGSKSIGEVAEINRSLIRRARAGELTPEDMSGGTITISNLGMYPVTRFTAILNPPEACILAVGAMVERPVWRDGGWEPVPLMDITGTFDHRIVDGAYGAAFLQELKALLENPALMSV